ncbi:hypothetical protein [Bifidobacterium tibiigranuli]|uniref:hypothetical protein n=1 Tax=Bifidobacterium tibiigranuli TaxID=2172043 RepID=UPI0026ED64AD|nr:hypothetical protein [Bifidobacterium tibiigranuli]MCI1713139.1 hypothetical protein [Bifidobacterium tibiigranuli]
MIIELQDGRWGALTINLGTNKVEQGVSNLLRLRNKISSRCSMNSDCELSQREKHSVPAYIKPLSAVQQISA